MSYVDMTIPVQGRRVSAAFACVFIFRVRSLHCPFSCDGQFQGLQVLNGQRSMALTPFYLITINIAYVRSRQATSITMSCFKPKSLLLMAVAAALIMALQSCGGSRQYLIIPHSVSTASPVSINDLRLQPGDYEILKTVSESASVFCEYKATNIRITSGESEFSLIFELKNNTWFLKHFSGAANLGYFTTDFESKPVVIPDAEEFARRAAMARIISIARDYGADAVVEPICVTRASNSGFDRIEYSCTVSAKLIKIKEK